LVIQFAEKSSRFLARLLAVGLLLLGLVSNAHADLTTGLVAYYPFDGNASDMSGNGNHGTLFGPTYSTDRHGNSGFQGAALEFNATQNDYAEIPNASQYAFGQGNFTTAMWVRGDSQPSYSALFIKASNPSHPYEGITLFLEQNGQGKVTGRTARSAELISARSDLDSQQWHHLAMSRQGTNLLIYVDGSFDATRVDPLTDVTNAAPIVLGANHVNRNAQNFHGSIDDIRIYDRALSAAEVAALYQLENTPPNQAPAFAESNATFTTAENNASASFVVTATDPDANTTLVYAKSGPDAAKFTLNVATGTLTFTNTPDFEANASAAGNNAFSLTITVTDGEGNATQAITVNVTDDPADNPLDLTSGLVAYYPFDGNASDMSGNGNHGTVNGATLGSDRHGGANKAYEFDGVNDKIVIATNNWPGGNSDRSVSAWFKTSSPIQSNLFTFGDGNRNNTRFSLLLNYPGAGKISFVGEGNDHHISTSSFSNAWMLSVITLSGNKGTVFLNSENIASFNKVLNTDGSMPLVIGSNSLTRNDEFFNGSIDDVRVYDRALSAAEVAALYQLESTSPNRPPTSIDLNGTTVAENLPAGTVVGEFNATDPDTNATHVFALVEGNGSTHNNLFTIDVNGTLKTAVILDHEANATLSIRIKAADEHNASIAQAFAIAVTVNNDFSDIADTILGFASGLDSAEGNLALWLDASNVNGSDNNGLSNGDAIGTWVDLSEGNLNAMAESGRQPIFKTNGINNKNSIHFTRDRMTISNGIDIQVDQARTAFFVIRSLSTALNSEFFGTETTEMLDIGTWSSQNRLRVRNATNSYSTENSFMLNENYLLMVRYAGSSTEAFLDGHEIISVASNRFGYALNRDLGIGWSNCNGRELVDAYLSEILVFDASLSNEHIAGTNYYLSQKWGLTSTVDSDGDGITDAVEIGGGSAPTIPESLSNNSPSDIHLTIASISENQPVGTILGEFTSTDPNANASHVFTLADGNGSAHNHLFTIDANGTLKTNAFLDYEANSTLSIRVKVTDEHNATFEKVFVISVTDIFENSPPAFDDANATFTTAENNASAFFVAATDPDANANLVYSKSGPDAGLFALNVATGQISFIHPPDFENPTDADQDGVYEVILSVTDGTATSSKDLKITVGDVFENRAPTGIDLNSTSVAENLPAGTVVGEFNATDPDGNATITFTFVDGNGSQHNNLFTIEANGTLKTAATFDHETNATLLGVRIQATDEHNASIAQAFVITVVDDPADNNTSVVEDNGTFVDTNATFSDNNATVPDSNGTYVDTNATVPAGNGTFVDTNATSPDNNGTLPGSNATVPDPDTTPPDQNETIVEPHEPHTDGNGTVPDQNGTLADHNQTHIDANGTIPDTNATVPEHNETIVPPPPPTYRPIARTLRAETDAAGKLAMSGVILTDGGASVTEVGFILSKSLFGELHSPGAIVVQGTPSGDAFTASAAMPDLGKRFYYRAYATNAKGTNFGSPKRFVVPEPVVPAAWWASAEEATAGWRISSWFGAFRPYDNGWIFHADLGWLYVQPDGVDGLWLWSKGKGWLWTNPGSYRYLYQAATHQWLYFLKRKNGQARFYNHTTGAVE
jgi:hypothetical protein